MPEDTETQIPEAATPLITRSTLLDVYPFRSLEEYAQYLIRFGIICEHEYYDPEGFDGGESLERISQAYAHLFL